MPATTQDYTLTYFRPGQLAFFATHPTKPEPSKEQIDELCNKSIEILKSLGYPEAKLELRPPYSFPAVPADCYDSALDDLRKPRITPRGESSLLFANITGVDDDPIKFFQLLVGLEEALLPVFMSEEFKLGAVSPNWLVSGAPEGSGSGGPGGWPVAYRGAPERAPYPFSNLPDIVKESAIGKGVDVVILDTAPCLQELTIAYDEWQGRHPLIHSLLRPGGPLILHPAPYDERYRIAGLRALGHDYKMTDHGLFAAGIIHTIAPCARIHLVEVLNPYGVGDLDSITRGLKFVVELMEDKPNQSFVVNCSLSLNLPVEVGHCRPMPQQEGSCFADLFSDLDRRLEEEICKQGSGWIDRQKLALEHPCDQIYTQKSRVIAAAGNDRRPGQKDPPQARYPAALESVQGVGALPKILSLTPGNKRKTSSYSNLADMPGKIGIATLGGEEGEGQGVLGLYLGDFPGCEANCTKWAWWTGTSFATPVVTGITAAVLSDIILLRAGAATQEAIDKLYSTGDIKNGETEGGEDVLNIMQGQPT